MRRQLHSGRAGSVLVAIWAAGMIACAPPPPGRVYVVRRPPPERVEVIEAGPGPAYVWAAGHWRWDRDEYVWVPGRWLLIERGRRAWAPGHWAHDRHGWYWVEGHWR